MSYCNKKPSKYGAQLPRSEYDQYMLKKYNPNDSKENYVYHAAPWPMQRTQRDKVEKQRLCPNCTFPNIENYCNANTPKSLEDPHNSLSYNTCN
jgi:hypothetical protein